MVERKANVSRRYNPWDIIRMRSYDGSYRVWEVCGVHLGALNQEDAYHLKPVDVAEKEELYVPCLMLETHPCVELVSSPPTQGGNFTQEQEAERRARHEEATQ